MSKAKKIALTSVVAVTAGAVTANSLTFTQAHAATRISRSQAQNKVKQIKKQADTIIKGKSYNSLSRSQQQQRDKKLDTLKKRARYYQNIANQKPKASSGTTRSSVQGVNLVTFRNGKINNIKLAPPIAYGKDGRLKKPVKPSHPHKPKTRPSVRSNQNVPQTNVFRANTVQASTINRGTSLSPSIKKLDNTNKRQAKAVKQLFGNKKVNKVGKTRKGSGKVTVKTRKGKATKAHSKLKTSLAKGKVAKATGIASVTTPAPATGASSSTDATGNLIATMANGQTSLTSDINNLDQQTQNQTAQLNNLLSGNSANVNVNGVQSGTDANGNPVTTNNQVGLNTPAGQNSVMASATALNPLSSLMADKGVAPVTTKADVKATKATSSSNNGSDVAKSTSAEADNSKGASSNAGAGSSFADNSGIKSSSADDGLSVGTGSSNNAGQLPQTGNSSSMAGIVAGSALTMSVAGAGVTAKVLRNKNRSF